MRISIGDRDIMKVWGSAVVFMAGLIMLVIGTYGLLADYALDRNIASDNNGWMLIIVGTALVIVAQASYSLITRLTEAEYV